MTFQVVAGQIDKTAAVEVVQGGWHIHWTWPCGPAHTSKVRMGEMHMGCEVGREQIVKKSENHDSPQMTRVSTLVY